jgi:hypothetical protein
LGLQRGAQRGGDAAGPRIVGILAERQEAWNENHDVFARTDSHGNSPHGRALRERANKVTKPARRVRANETGSGLAASLG